MTRWLVLLFFVLVFSNHSMAQSTSVSIDETKCEGMEADDEQLSSPLPEAYIEGGSLTTNYGIRANYSLEDYTVLRASTEMRVSSSEQDEAGGLWDNVIARAKASSSVSTYGFVQNPGDFGSGIIEFSWTVTGSSFLKLTDPVNVTVNEFSALTTLASDGPGVAAVGGPLAEFEFLEGEGELDVPVGAGPFIFTAEWTDGELVPIFFDLETQVMLDISSSDGVGSFNADLATRFGNSAFLTTTVKDTAGNVIQGASFVAVPEPSTLWILVVCGIASAVRRDRY